jgi:hypothetical protein
VEPVPADGSVLLDLPAQPGQQTASHNHAESVPERPARPHAIVASRRDPSSRPGTREVCCLAAVAIAIEERKPLPSASARRDPLGRARPLALRRSTGLRASSSGGSPWALESPAPTRITPRDSEVGRGDARNDPDEVAGLTPGLAGNDRLANGYVFSVDNTACERDANISPSTRGTRGSRLLV